jgi:hypothetical protein
MGKKAKHSSVCKHAKQLIGRLEAIDEVTKVVIGLSSCCRHAFSPGMAKVQALTEAGFRLNVYGGNGITSVFVVVDPASRDAVLEKVSDFIVVPKDNKDAKSESSKSVVHSKRKRKLVASDKRKRNRRSGRQLP